MTRLEAFRYYESLLDSGEIESFRKIEKEISEKDFNLLFYDDGGVTYNPLHGCLETYGDLFGPSPDLLKSLGHLGGERTKRISDLTQEELEFFEGYDDDPSNSYI